MAALAVELFQTAGGQRLASVGFELQANAALAPLRGFILVDFIFEDQEDEADGEEDRAQNGGASEEKSAHGAADSG